MRETKTHIDINAPAAVVWAILADFGAYGRWNPLIRGVLGRASEGRTIEIKLRTEAGTDVNVRPRIVRLREFREMRWLDSWRLPGLFSTERRFRIEQRSSGVRFHHVEKLGGVLRPFFKKPNGLETMNDALKVRAERASTDRSPAAR